MSLRDSLVLVFFFTIYYVTLSVRSGIVNSENPSVFFYWSEREKKKKYKIRMGLNRTLLAFYETSITRKRITIITSGTRYLFRCKELCKNVCYIALDFKKL